MLLDYLNVKIDGLYELKSVKPTSFIFVFIEDDDFKLQLNKEEEKEFSTGILFLNNKKIDQIILKSIKSNVTVIEVDELFASDFLVDIHSTLKEYHFVKLDNEECYINVKSLYHMMKFEIESNHKNSPVINQLFKSVLAIYNTELMKYNSDTDFTNSKKNLYINNLIKLIEENYKTNQPADFYATSLSISKRHLNNLSKKYFNTTFNKLIIKRKINEAKLFLKDSNLQIDEIGYSLGFNEKSYFTRVFKSTTGISPKEFREQYLKAS